MWLPKFTYSRNVLWQKPTMLAVLAILECSVHVVFQNPYKYPQNAPNSMLEHQFRKISWGPNPPRGGVLTHTLYINTFLVDRPELHILYEPLRG